MQWRRRAWRAGALGWAERRLAERKIHLTGKPDQFHVRSWSTVIRLPTDRGVVFFKAVWRPLRFEAALTAAIAAWAPDDVGMPLAVDERRGWLLLEDGGQRLREILTNDRDIGHWHRILRQYADLQLAVAPHLREALKLGTPDRRAKALASQYAHNLGASRIVAQFANVRGAQTLPHKRNSRIRRPASSVKVDIIHGQFSAQRKLLHVVTRTHIAAGMERLTAQKHVLSGRAKGDYFYIHTAHIRC